MSAEHTQDWYALLPWYVNGTLDADQSVQLEQAMANDKALQDEYQWLVRLQDAVKAQDLPVAPTDFGWQQLKRQIRQEKRKQRSPWLSVASIAAAMVISFQVGTQWQQGQVSSSPNLLSEQVAPYSNHIIVQLRFKSDIALTQVQQILLPLQASIIEGPSALGLYRVAIPTDGAIRSGMDAEQYFNKQAIVESVSIEQANGK